MALGLVQRLRNADFNLEGIMVELNQNKKLRPPDWPDAVRELYFNPKMGKFKYTNVYKCSTESLF